jgi:AmiR/NasT family two-component response regulator
MHAGNTILMLHDRKEPLGQLTDALKKQNVNSIHAASCAETCRILSGCNPPKIVFTDLTASNGTWADALLVARKSPVPVSLIVVSDVPDLCLCEAAAGCGAFGLIVPPLPEHGLQTLLQSAFADTAKRRGTKARASTKAA